MSVVLLAIRFERRWDLRRDDTDIKAILPQNLQKLVTLNAAQKQKEYFFRESNYYSIKARSESETRAYLYVCFQQVESQWVLLSSRIIGDYQRVP